MDQREMSQIFDHFSSQPTDFLNGPPLNAPPLPSLGQSLVQEPRKTSKKREKGQAKE